MSAALILPRGPLAQQPQQAALTDRSNPFTAGLASLVTASSPFDAARNAAALSVGASISLAAGPSGLAWQGSAAYGGVNLGVSGGLGALLDQNAPWSWYGRIYVSNVSTQQYFVADYDSSGNDLSFAIQVTNGGAIKVTTRNTGGTYIDTIGPTVSVGWHDIEFSSTGGSAYVTTLSVDGVDYLSGASTSNMRAGVALRLMCAGSYTSAYFLGRVSLSAFWRRQRTAAERAATRANPWQLFQAPRRRLWLAVDNTGTGAALSGAASAVASATGGLATSIPLAASAAVVASASASLSAQIALSGATAAQATASASLSTQVRLAGSAGAAASASGALSTQIALAGAAAGAASSAGALSTQIALAGTTAASSSASGALTAGVGLSGSASVSASASGSLTTSIRLAGSASCSSSASGNLSTTPAGAALSGAAAAASIASGSLTTAIALAGAAVAQASASGSLSGQAAALSGSASASSSATGSLSTQILVAGAAAAVTSAVGTLATQIRLSGAGTGSASASGVLATGLLPPEPNPHRLIVVEGRKRHFAVQRRQRHFVARRRIRHFEVGR
jgi:hypothetical protein